MSGVLLLGGSSTVGISSDIQVNSLDFMVLGKLPSRFANDKGSEVSSYFNIFLLSKSLFCCTSTRHAIISLSDLKAKVTPFDFDMPSNVSRFYFLIWSFKGILFTLILFTTNFSTRSLRFSLLCIVEVILKFVAAATADVNETSSVLSEKGFCQRL